MAQSIDARRAHTVEAETARPSAVRVRHRRAWRTAWVLVSLDLPRLDCRDLLALSGDEIPPQSHPAFAPVARCPLFGVLAAVPIEPMLPDVLGAGHAAGVDARRATERDEDAVPQVSASVDGVEAVLHATQVCH